MLLLHGGIIDKHINSEIAQLPQKGSMLYTYHLPDQ